MKYDLKYYEDKLMDEKITTHMMKKWVSKLDILIYAANNEQKAWTPEMLGYPTEGMPTKAVSGFRQTGDYHMLLQNYDMIVGVLGERKSINDLYGTLFGGRERFHREIDRFHEDPRFDTMVIFVEGSEPEFMKYLPPFHKGKFSKRTAAKTKGGSQQMVAQKVGAIHSLYARGVAIYFCGSRDQAAKNYVDISEKWITQHYRQILKLDD